MTDSIQQRQDVERPETNQAKPARTFIDKVGGRYVWVDEPEPPKPVAIGPVFIARSDRGGMMIPGSRLSNDFACLASAFGACTDLQRQHPDAAIFENTRRGLA